MAGSGLSYGAGATGDTLERILARRMEEQKNQQMVTQQGVENAFKQRQLDQQQQSNDLLRQQQGANLASEASLRQATAGEAYNKGASIGDVLPDQIASNPYVPRITTATLNPGQQRSVGSIKTYSGTMPQREKADQDQQLGDLINDPSITPEQRIYFRGMQATGGKLPGDANIFAQRPPTAPKPGAPGGPPAAAAEAAANKAGQDYLKAKQAGADIQTFVDEARKGNVLSYAYLPTEGVLTLNTSRGVTRVNMSEISQYAGAGSAIQKLQGFFGKATAGRSIPDSVLNDIASLHQHVTANAGDNYRNALKVVNDTYKSNFQPSNLEPSPVAAPTRVYYDANGNPIKR